MIVCPNCGKENQKRYKFCLACGAKLPGSGPNPSAPEPGSHRVPAPPPPMISSPGPSPSPPAAIPPPPVSASRPPPSAPPPPPLGATGPRSAQPAVQRPKPRPAPQAPAPSPAGGGVCPNCGFENPPGFKFCGRCGHTLPVEATPPSEDVAHANTVFAADAADVVAAVATNRATAAPDATIPAEPDVTEVPGSSRPSGHAADSASLSALPPPPPLNTNPPLSPHTSPLAAPAPVIQLDAPPAKLVMLGPDGQPVGERALSSGERLDVGRNSGPPWHDDAYLDPQHAYVTVTADGLLIQDSGSLNGVFVKLNERVEVQDGDLFRVGQELIQYEDLPEPMPTSDGTERMGSPNPGYWGRLCVLVDPGAPSMAFPIEGEGVVIGREQGDLTFPHDGYVSGRHCRIVGDDTGVYVEDLGSSNGTYMRVRSGVTVPFGCLVLIGQKLFQVKRLDGG